jgi:SAM-dependent methyltransferase
MARPFEYGGAELDALEHARNYYRAILRHFRPHLGARTLEIGAGTGNFARVLLDSGRIMELTLVEPAANLAPTLRRRFDDDPRVSVASSIDDVPTVGAWDSVVMTNVLEHVADDAGTLRTIHRLLSPGGTCLAFVPALAALYGSLDAAFGHHRRYTKRGVRRLLLGAGLAPVAIRYFNMIGVMTWLVAGRILRRTTIATAAVHAYDGLVVPWSQAVEWRCEPPIGQSLVVIARR